MGASVTRSRRRQFDRRRRETQPSRAWYSTARWQRRRKAQLQAEPLCRFCEQRRMIVGATIADHIVPHRGNETLFWDAENLQSLCAACHNSDAQRIERGGQPKATIGLDGYPIEETPVFDGAVRRKRRA